MKITTDPPPGDDGYGNDAAVEANWAAEAFTFAERHLLLMASMSSPKGVKLTPYVALVSIFPLLGGGGCPSVFRVWACVCASVHACARARACACVCVRRRAE